MYCIKCGKEVGGEVKYCSYCGAYIESKVVKKRVSKKIKLLFGICGVVLVGITTIAVFGKEYFVIEGSKETGIVASGIEKSDEKSKEDSEQYILEDMKENAGTLEEERIEHVKISKPSVWHDGVEFKILEYLDNETMRVKFILEKFIVQAVVPRTLESDDYFIEQYSDYDSAGDNEETYLKVINTDKGDALYFAYGMGEQVIGSFSDTYESWKKQGESDECHQIETVCNGEGLVIVTSDSVAWSKYDKDEHLLQGYMTVVADEEEAAVFLFGLLTDDESQYEMIKDSVQQVVIRREIEDDMVLNVQVDNEYEQRMADMFQKYREITNSPSEYLQTNYNAQGSDYNYHYLFDVTGDGVPEIFFQGNPRQFCVVGETNAVCLNGVDEIVWTNEENIFYTKVTSQAGVNWDKYEVWVDEQGYMEIKSVATMAIDHEGNYSLNGEEITREKYMDVMSIVEQDYLPKPRRVYSKEYVLSKKGFNNSVKKLADEFLYE